MQARIAHARPGLHSRGAWTRRIFRCEHVARGEHPVLGRSFDMVRGLRVGMAVFAAVVISCGRGGDGDEDDLGTEPEYLGTAEGPVVSCPERKALVCHKPGDGRGQTLCIGRPAVNAHLRHGDTLGECAAATDGGVITDGGVDAPDAGAPVEPDGGTDAGTGGDAGTDAGTGAEDGGTEADAGTDAGAIL